MLPAAGRPYIRGLGAPAGSPGTAFPLGKLGLVALSRGDPRAAEPLLRESLGESSELTRRAEGFLEDTNPPL